jgi:hypothetical protein
MRATIPLTSREARRQIKFHFDGQRIVNPPNYPNIFRSYPGMMAGMPILTRYEGQKFGFPLFQGR